GTDHRITLIAKLVKIRIVCPNVLNELELADKTCADYKRCNTAINAILRRTFRQSWTVCGSTTNYFASLEVPDGRVARIHSANIGSERDGIALWIHFRVVEIVVALRVVGE